MGFTNSERTGEQIRTGSSFLKQADILVKEKKLDEALEAIAGAKSSDPRNPYIEAYEGRVVNLLRIRNEELATQRLANKVRINEYLSRAKSFATESQFDRALEEIGTAFHLDPQDQEILELKYEVEKGLHARDQETRSELAEKICGMLRKAEEFIIEGNWGAAIGEATEAFLLDPVHEALFSFEERHLEEILQYQSGINSDGGSISVETRQLVLAA